MNNTKVNRKKKEDTLVKETPATQNIEENPQIWNDGVVLALHVLLPLAIAGLIWGRKAIISRLLLQLDRSCFSVFYPKFSKTEKVLKWTMTHLPYMQGGLATIWKDGAQLCNLINSVIPGACPNPHRHWKKAPTHGQALAYKYLGVTPVFSDDHFNQRNLTTTIEKELVEYMLSLQQSMTKISRGDDMLFCNHYVARGMGLVTGEQYRRTILYIYPNNKNYTGNLLINIRGPYNTHGSATLYFHDLEYANNPRKLLERNNNRELKTQKSFFENLSDDFSNLLTLKNPKEPSNDIEIKIEIEQDRAKIIFLPRNSGVYEVCLTTNGEHISGSPYNINVEKNRSGIKDDISQDDSKSKLKPNLFTKSNESYKSKFYYTKYENTLLSKPINEEEIVVPEIQIKNELNTEIIEEENNNEILTDSTTSTTSTSSTSKEEPDETDDICMLIINENNNNEEICENLNNDIPKPETKLKIPTYNPDLLVGHTTFTIEDNKIHLEKASSVFNDTEQEDDSNPNLMVYNVSKGNIKQTINPKRKLTKCKAIVDDEILDFEQIPNLPNLIAETKLRDTTNVDPLDFRQNFLKRRDFWDRISSTNPSLNSSSISLSDSTDSGSLRRLNYINKVFKQRSGDGESTAGNQFRSLDYIQQRRKSIRGDFFLLRERYRSADELSFPSVRERKDLFLKEVNVQNDASKPNRLRDVGSFSGGTEEILAKRGNVFGSVHDRIKLFDSGFLNDGTSKIKLNQKDNSKDFSEFSAIKLKIKERFEKAQQYFKTLETLAQTEEQLNESYKQIVGRRHSLDSNRILRFSTLKPGGSLRALNTETSQTQTSSRVPEVDTSNVKNTNENNFNDEKILNNQVQYSAQESLDRIAFVQQEFANENFKNIRLSKEMRINYFKKKERKRIYDIFKN